MIGEALGLYSEVEQLGTALGVRRRVMQLEA